jgi:hypothetical protein
VLLIRDVPLGTRSGIELARPKGAPAREPVTVTR